MKSEHTAQCQTCGLNFEMNNLKQVIAHEHTKQFIMETEHKTKKIINNAREVYPYCGGEFAGGVHTYMQGMPMPQRPCDDDHIQGWICADRDNLLDKYVLNF